jgi:hypothetical protein
MFYSHIQDTWNAFSSSPGCFVLVYKTHEMLFLPHLEQKSMWGIVFTLWSSTVKSTSIVFPIGSFVKTSTFDLWCWSSRISDQHKKHKPLRTIQVTFLPSFVTMWPIHCEKTYLLEIQDGRHCRQGFSIHVAPYGNMKKKIGRGEMPRRHLLEWIWYEL